MQGRKRGGQPGNQNAVTHGRHSAPRKVQRAIEAVQRRRREAEWEAKIPVTDYGAICAQIQGAKATKH